MEIRFAKVTEIPLIMRFIDEYWKKNHILATNKELFEWQYVFDNKVNYVIGIDNNNEILGVLGYILYSEKDVQDICLALWKAKEGTGFLGIKLLMYLTKEIPHRSIFCNGINLKTTEDIYKRAGFQIGELEQWYRLSNKITDYKIAKVVDKTIISTEKNYDIILSKVTSIEEINEICDSSIFDKESLPYKSALYFEMRYLNHPIYEYDVYAVSFNNEAAKALLVLRTQCCNDAKAIRIVDFVSRDKDLLYKCSNAIDKLIEDTDAEYADMYEFGLSGELLEKSGWSKVGNDSNIIPNYFSPFEQKNVQIFISTTDDNIVIFKGDGDQDRPN